MDLFSFQNEELSEREKRPLLADRMRPRNLEEFIGQEHLVGEGKLLRRAIEADQVMSIIFYGPPGSGKTTLAHIISERTAGRFVKLNAVTASVKEVRETIEEAKQTWELFQRKTILFLDEVHRFNSARQDVLLPAVEQGTIIFIGATTENPFHSINGALLSRATLFQLHALTADDALAAMRRALVDEERGLGGLSIVADEEALRHIAEVSQGDIRRALSALEMAAVTTPSDMEGTVHITLAVAEESIRRPTIRANQSTQYDILSAFHKSLRGSSDAALFWFLYAVEELGMDPMVFIRRLVVMCSEDIGLANSQAMVQAVAALDAYTKIGWPESKYNITQAILFAVESPKSNAVSQAITHVTETIKRYGNVEVPLYLRDGHYSGSKVLGHVGYQYPHDYPGHYVVQDYLPEPLNHMHFYEASEQGTEERIRRGQLARQARVQAEETQHQQEEKNKHKQE